MSALNAHYQSQHAIPSIFACHGDFSGGAIPMMRFHPCMTMRNLARLWNWAADNVPAVLPECAGIPAPRKKILTVTHPSDCPQAPEGTGSSYRRPPMR
jgi:hypothetical protein